MAIRYLSPSSNHHEHIYRLTDGINNLLAAAGA
jgi:hypothetical protein